MFVGLIQLPTSFLFPFDVLCCVISRKNVKDVAPIKTNRPFLILVYILSFIDIEKYTETEL